MTIAHSDVQRVAYPAILTLPIPPSLNTMLSGRLKDRIKRKSDLGWLTVEAWHNALRPTFRGPVVVEARFYFPDRRRRDRENYSSGGLKVYVDTLVKLGCIERDDAEWFTMTVHMLHDRGNPRLELEICELGQSAPNWPQCRTCGEPFDLLCQDYRDDCEPVEREDG